MAPTSGHVGGNKIRRREAKKDARKQFDASDVVGETRMIQERQFRRWRFVVFWGVVAAVLLVIAVLAAVGQQPQRRELPKDLAEEVAQDEKSIHETYDKLDDLEKIRDAISKADRVLQIRLESQGQEWWETVNARLQLAKLRQFLTLSEDQRAKVAETFRRNDQVFASFNVHKYDEAIELMRANAEIDRQIFGTGDRDYAADLDILAMLYASAGRSQEAEPLYRQAAEIYKSTVGEDHPDYAQTQDELGKLYQMTGRYQQAEPFYRRALDIRRNTRGEDHPDYTQSLDYLGRLYNLMGRYREAEPLLRQALEIRKRTLGNKDPTYAGSLNSLAMLYYSTSRYSQAAPLFREAVEVIRAEGGSNLGLVLSNLADSYAAGFRYKEAEPLYHEALDVIEKAAGRQHPTYAIALSKFAELSAKMGRYADAEQRYRQALGILEQTIGREHPNYAIVLHSLARLYSEMARYDEAQSMLDQSLEILKKTLGDASPEYAGRLSYLAVLYERRGQYERAETLFKQIALVQKNALGDANPDYANAIESLADIYETLGRYEEAEPLFRQAMEIRRQAFGEESIEYSRSLNNLANLYSATGRSELVEPLLRQAVGLVKKASGDQNPDYATVLDNLAGFYRGMGRSDQAEPLTRQALEIRKSVLGEQHPDYALSLDQLALVDYSLGKYEQAEPLYRQAAEIQKRALGEGHPYYASTLSSLAALYYAMRRYNEAEPIYLQALQIQKKSTGDQNLAYAISLSNLAALYSTVGRNGEAEPLERQALEISKSNVGVEHPQYALMLNTLALTLAATKRSEEASRLMLESAQAEWKCLTRNFPTMTSLQKWQFTNAGSFTQPEELWTLVFQGNGVDPKRGLEAALLSKELLFEASRQETGALRAAVAAAPPEWQSKWRVREQLLRQYSTLAMHSLSESGRGRPADGQPVDAAQLRSLLENLERLNEEVRQTNPAYATQARLQQVTLDDVIAALRPGETLIEYVKYRPYDFVGHNWGSPHYGAFVLSGGSGQVSAIELGDAATIDRAVEQFRAEVRGFIDQFPSARLEPSPAQIGRSESQIALVSASVRERVWQPLEKQLSGARRVYVATDGSLRLIPFDTLARKDAAGGWRYLVEDRELIYLGTGRDLATLALSGSTRINRPKTALLVGNPAFGATPLEAAMVVAGLRSAEGVAPASASAQSGNSTLGAAAGGGTLRHEIPRNWEQVPALTELVQRASAQLKRMGWTVAMLTGRGAVEEAVETMEAPRILQFATHGYVLDRPENIPGEWDIPLVRSMLMMAGVNLSQPGGSVYYHAGNQLLTETQARARGVSPQQLQAARVEVGDGILTAQEVMHMDLRNTDLVNLTACETGLGEATGDGIAGLRGAFLLAGARSLTMSMWEVPASETTLQIEDFYSRWLGGGKVPDARYKAFRAAQLAALARARQAHGSGHPFYWAGTVYVGDPGDLPSVAAAASAAK